MSTLQRAIEIATIAHKDQVDKAGKPYIDHPLRVMQAVEGEDAKIVAVLHDVLEDCPTFTLDYLRSEGFSQEVLVALAHITKTELDTYRAYIKRVSNNRLATQVKLADLKDNSDLTRLGREITERDVRRIFRYAWATEYLENVFW